MKQDIGKRKLKHESEIEWNTILIFAGKQIITGGIAHNTSKIIKPQVYVYSDRAK